MGEPAAVHIAACKVYALLSACAFIELPADHAAPAVPMPFCRSPLERARIEATPHGRVKQTAGGARLMDGSLGWQEALSAKSLGLSRALGDTSERPWGWWLHLRVLAT